jgi:hypothetical protein
LVDYDLEKEEGYGPEPELEESIGPSRLYATTNTRPLYVAGQQGSAGGRIMDPRGGMTNVRFNEPMARMTDLREVAARIQFDIVRLSGMMRGLNQTVASQANNNLMMSLFSLILGGPKLDSVVVDKITLASGATSTSISPSAITGSTAPATTGSTAPATTGSTANILPATLGISKTQYKLDIMTLLPFFMFNMGGQMGAGSSTGGGMFGGSNFMMMLLMLILIKSMNEDK